MKAVVIGVLMAAMISVVKADERKPHPKFICIDTSSGIAVIWEDDEECPEGC